MARINCKEVQNGIVPSKSAKMPITMKVAQQAPCPALAPYVSRYWELKHDLPNQINLEVPFGCTGRSHFVFSLQNPFHATFDSDSQPLNICESTFFCQITRPFTKTICGPTSGIIVDFTPTALHTIWKLPVHELTEQAFDLRTLANSDIRQLTEQLQEVNSSDLRFALVESYLLKRLTRIKKTDGRIESATQLIQQQPETINIKKLASYLNTSERTLNRRFTEQVGLSPKYFVRIQRFLKTRYWLDQHPQPNWNDLLPTAGYYDQAHLINEFRFFTGKSPLLYGAGNCTLHDIFRQE